VAHLEREIWMARRKLTVDRHEEIKRRLADGRSLREIATALGCSRRLVRQIRDVERLTHETAASPDPLWMSQLEWPVIIIASSRYLANRNVGKYFEPSSRFRCPPGGSSFRHWGSDGAGFMHSLHNLIPRTKWPDDLHILSIGRLEALQFHVVHLVALFNVILKVTKQDVHFE